mmetsp:Transcript_64412/g.114510  ORF Transcript_64412/g.114510 Transcript_64412/m.114510 type:complete len:311 (-) Transcript_64412:216-1148(-)
MTCSCTSRVHVSSRTGSFLIRGILSPCLIAKEMKKRAVDPSKRKIVDPTKSKITTRFASSETVKIALSFLRCSQMCRSRRACFKSGGTNCCIRLRLPAPFLLVASAASSVTGLAFCSSSCSWKPAPLLVVLASAASSTVVIGLAFCSFSWICLSSSIIALRWRLGLSWKYSAAINIPICSVSLVCCASTTRFAMWKRNCSSKSGSDLFAFMYSFSCVACSFKSGSSIIDSMCASTRSFICFARCLAHFWNFRSAITFFTAVRSSSNVAFCGLAMLQSLVFSFCTSSSVTFPNSDFCTPSDGLNAAAYVSA